MLLYTQVSEAIIRAEHLEDNQPDSPETKAAFREICRLELDIIQLKDITDAERNTSRRSAVISALKAGDTKQAQELLASFAALPEFDKSINKELRKLFDSIATAA